MHIYLRYWLCSRETSHKETGPATLFMGLLEEIKDCSRRELAFVRFFFCALILLADANDLFHKRKTKGQEDDPRVNIGMSDFKSHPNSSLKMIRHRIHYFFLTLTKPVCTKQQPHEVMDKPTTLKLSIFMSLTDFLKGQVTV